MWLCGGALHPRVQQPCRIAGQLRLCRMGQQRQRNVPQSKPATQQYHRRPPKQAKASRCCSPCLLIAVGISVLLICTSVAVIIYRERFPTEQRCPPETDRFYDHCKEGRKHYLLSLDWTCLGSRRAEAMRMALSLPSDGKALKGVGEVPSWLTDDNAEALRGAPCVRDVTMDKACRYCKPTPKPLPAKTEDKAGAGSEEQGQQQSPQTGATDGASTGQASTSEAA